ncbi:histidine phosphatase family protein [Falsiroseomonas bella]|uniref:Histidine phosphatase family protein n=1 Tax=Falsiroseomonas bella TaxID=2184016 RepID=A0A317FF73_9PROT|nr:histidine phosphatase family protein [Falsiroseomonas bella]PWS37022.1 histidine phosphatase family protein [Falsiroseomonas bella]
MATRLLLARHAAHAEVGRVLSGRTDRCGLSSEGEAQAARLARQLRDCRPTTLPTSPRRRARETAAILGKALDLHPAQEPLLDEIDFGAWTGCAFASLEDDPAWRSWNTQRGTAMPPGGETMAEAAARVLRWIGTLPARFPDGTLLAVTHADVIKAALLVHLGAGLDAYWRLEIAPASISELELWPGGGRVIRINHCAGDIAA